MNPIHTLIYTKHGKIPGQTEMKHNWPRPFCVSQQQQIYIDTTANNNRAEFLFSCALFPLSCSSA